MPTPPPPAELVLPTAPAALVRQSRFEIDALSARVLTWFALATGVTLVGVALLQLAFVGRAGAPLTPFHLGFAAVLLAGAASSWWLSRIGRPRAAAFAVLLLSMLGLGLHAYATGLGIHSLALASTSLVIAVAGAVLSIRAAALLAAFYVAMAVALYAVEGRGGIDGMASAAFPGASRVVSHVMLAALAWPPRPHSRAS